MKVLFVVLLLAATSSAQLISSIKKSYNDIMAKWGRCPSFRNDNTCAYLFDEENCEGWVLPVKPGFTELGNTFNIFSITSDKPKKNDAEAVVVRDGCLFIGYDHTKGTMLTGLGDSVVIAAIDGNKYVDLTEDEYDFKNKISSMDCVCQGFAFSKPATGKWTWWFFTIDNSIKKLYSFHLFFILILFFWL